MRLRYAVFLLALLCLGAGIGRAQSVPTLEVGVSYSHVLVSPTNIGLGNFTMDGVSGQVAYNFNKWFSAVGDVGYYTHQQVPSVGIVGLNIQPTEISYLVGPRLSYRHLGRFTPYGQVLVGLVHDTPTTLDDPAKAQTKLAYSAGAGIDVKIKSYLAVKAIGLDVMRTQFAELGTTRQVQTNVRISVGVVLLF